MNIHRADTLGLFQNRHYNLSFNPPSIPFLLSILHNLLPELYLLQQIFASTNIYWADT
jgi:hypothetical protein